VRVKAGTARAAATAAIEALISALRSAANSRARSSSHAGVDQLEDVQEVVPASPNVGASDVRKSGIMVFI
jgi:hypothetical protein